MGGRGRGGPGGGRGWRNMFHATGLTRWQRAMAAEPAPAPPASAPADRSPEVAIEQELASLQAQAQEAAAALEEIRQRIDQIAASRSPEAGD